LIDVREPEECAVTRLGTAEYIPMSLLPAAFQRLEGLAEEADLLVLCHHGVRSLQVVMWLRERGVENCYSVAGGIDRWSRELDPAIPRY
jgi:rhodanese-related sulfurtransferase